MKIDDMEKLNEAGSDENDNLNICYYSKTVELFDVLQTPYFNTGHIRTRSNTPFSL
jgi:hypothetical protein